MKKLLTVIMALIIFGLVCGCMGRIQHSSHVQYEFQGKTVKVGMTQTEVRELIGVPTRVSVPESDADWVQMAFSTPMSAKMNKDKIRWIYGTLSNGSKDALTVVFTQGTVTEIVHYTRN